MEELVLEKPDMPKLMKELSKDWFIAWLESQGKKKKGKSSLKKWTCPVCGLNARMEIKDNPQIRHDPCKKKTGHEVFFVHDDGLKHTIICRKGFRK